MAGERTFLQVPPDSTGKRVRMTHTAEIFYQNGVPDNYNWGIGEMYRTTFSDGNVYTIHVHGYHRITATTGLLEVHYNKTAKYNNLTPTIGANIIDEDGVTVRATVQSFRDVYINSNHIIGYDNPEYGVDVDPTGSMNVRFAEGLPQLDAFGKLRVSGKTILGDYVFTSTLSGDFARIQYGGGTVTHDTTFNGLLLTTPSGTSTDVGNNREKKAQYTSNTYHHYFPGSSHLIMMTAAVGDTGQAGVVREWGYYDDDNGYYFRVNEEQTSEAGDNFEFVIRSSADGNLREKRIARDYTKDYLWDSGTSTWTETATSTDGWNGDPWDGTGDSATTISLTSDNIYWIDIQWLGAGRVRFGTFIKGERIVIHQYYHDNNNGLPHSQTGALPLQFAQYNVLDQTVTSSSTLKVWCAIIATESNIDLKGLGRAQVETFTATFDPNNLNDWKGTNDTGKGDRVGVISDGVTGSTTTLTVPNTIVDTGAGPFIRAGYRLHLEATNGGSGTLQMGTTVLEIVNSTTIIVDKAPATPLTGVEDIRFHLHVDDEYNLIGILTPRAKLDGQTSTNRTLYLPQQMEAMAYHADGSEAFCEIEVYVNPVLSGNATVLPLESTDTPAGPFVEIEPDDPGCAVVSYKNTGLVNYLGGGYHQLATYFKGSAPARQLGGAYGNFQSGAFKLYSAGGGNNRCPIKRVIQSPASGIPTVIEIDTGTVFANGGPSFSLHREGNPIQFENIPGLIGSDATNGLNDGITNGAGKTYYLRMISESNAELYEDQAFTVPADTSAISNATNGNSLTWKPASVPTGGFILSGYGEYLYFAIVAKPVGISAAGNSYGSTTSTIDQDRDITVHFILNWNEVIQ